MQAWEGSLVIIIKLGSNLCRNLTNSPGKLNADRGGKQIHINNRGREKPYQLSREISSDFMLKYKGQPDITRQRESYSRLNGKERDKLTRKGHEKTT